MELRPIEIKPLLFISESIYKMGLQKQDRLMAILRGEISGYNFKLLKIYREHERLMWLENDTIRLWSLGSVVALSKRGEVLRSKYRVPDSIVLSPVWNDYNAPHVITRPFFKLNQGDQSYLLSKFIERCYLEEMRKPFNLPFNHVALLNLMGSYTLVELRR